MITNESKMAMCAFVCLGTFEWKNELVQGEVGKKCVGVLVWGSFLLGIQHEGTSLKTSGTASSGRLNWRAVFRAHETFPWDSSVCMSDSTTS